MHVKHFKGLFCHKYGEPLPENYSIEIIADGDDELPTHALALYDLLENNNERWEVSGHGEIFRYILKGVSLDFSTDGFSKTDDWQKANFICAVMIYHEKMAVIVVASTKEYLEANKGLHGY